ncbi:McrC family protein [Novosphingobium sp. AAP83]|uniref:McrC family protein n=1 Tax=Novosphingobium sp. AAP83 TaxID=1523425 RepID=UPI000AF8E98F|nr:McrC family protein [Novosphingobium sp. AAP83]
MWPRVDDPKHGVSQSDVYQMMAHGQLYQCDALTLLYPHHSALTELPGVLGSYKVPPVGQQLSAATIDISGLGNIKEALRSIASV